MATGSTPDNDPEHTPDLSPHSDGRQNRRSEEEEIRPAEGRPDQQQEEEEEDADGEEGEEEAEECGFCLFMKGGPCRESFINWEVCVEEAEKAKEDIVSKCHQATMVLKQCMEANSDYYEPVLKAEKELADAAMEEEASQPILSNDSSQAADSLQSESKEGIAEDKNEDLRQVSFQQTSELAAPSNALQPENKEGVVEGKREDLQQGSSSPLSEAD